MKPGKYENESPDTRDADEREARGAEAIDNARRADLEIPPDDDASASPEGLKAALIAAEAKAQEHYDSFLRAKAEADNTRRRALEDVSKARKFGIENFAEALLPVMDSLQAALGDTSADAKTLREGVELTQKQLTSAFERHRLTVIDPAGEKFDPHRHQAISTVPAPEGTAPNHVVAVLQKGWMLADRVLRPALVTVAS